MATAAQERDAKFHAAASGSGSGNEHDSIYQPANQSDTIHNKYLSDRQLERDHVSLFSQLCLALGWKPSAPRMDDSKTVREYVEKLEKRNKGIIDPRVSQFIGNWDLITMALLLFTTLITPYEVVFLPASVDLTSLFVINRFVDGCFIFDMFIQFNLSYQAKPEDGGHWVMVRARTRGSSCGG